MCNFVVIDREVYKTVGELRRAIGNKHVLPSEYITEDGGGLTNRMCLCCVDIHASAQSAGYRSKFDRETCMNFIWTKKP